MCIQHPINQKTRSFFIYLIAICFGVYSGFSDYHVLHDVAGAISEMFVRIFKCISLPIISLSIIVTLLHYTPGGPTRKYLQRAVVYTFSTTIIAAMVACMLYLIIQPKNVGVSIAANAVPTAKLSYLKHIIDLVPAGIFTPFIEHQVIGVLLVSALIGFAIRHIQNTDVRDTISNFFKAVHEIFLVITGWVVKIIPIGLYGFIATSVIQFKSGVDIRGIGAYLAVVVLANVIQGVVVLPGWLLMNGINPIATFKGVSSALSLAFFSKSSAGTLPVTIMNAEKNLRIDSKISRLLLPICTTINMNGCAAFIFTTVIYLMQNHGIAIDVSTMLIWIVIATIAAVGNAGVPMGCFFLSASLLASQNVPIGLLGIILPFYSVIDMIETSLNVWSDVCVTKTVAQKVR